MLRQKLKLREDLGQGEFDLKKTNSTAMREESTNRALPSLHLLITMGVKLHDIGGV